MKKIVLLISSCLILSSCSSYEPINLYIKEEVKKNKDNKIVSILYSNKPSSNIIPDIYNEKNFKTKIHYSKTFNQLDYEFLKKKSKNDTIINFWTRKEQEKFGFDKLTDYSRTESNFESDVKHVFYRISNPINLKKSKTTIFLISKSGGQRNNIETSVIISKKVKGKWEFVEKILSQSEN